MKEECTLCAIFSVFFGLTLVSGFILNSTPATAGETALSNVSIVVPESCTITVPSGTENIYNVSMLNNQYRNNIGKTRLSIFCNTNQSFAVYAVGYSNDVFGNTEMIAGDAAASNIVTGTATSGDISQWAMKLEAVTGTSGSYTPTIISPFNNFANVPSSYAKAAEVTSVTSATVESAIEASYAIFVSAAQKSGSYTGKVRYTTIQPSGAVPNQPYTTTSGHIGYYPNADGRVIDTMGEQNIANTDTGAVLWANNFKQPGYGFAGWSDKYDWEINANDIAGNGTGSNEGFHIYGPNQRINFAAGQYSEQNKGLSLYAVWVKSAGTIQGWNGCGGLNTGQITALTDVRDNNTYAVAKLADGKCWMIENLRLGGTTEMIMDSSTTNIADGSTFTLSASQDPVQTAWCAGYNSGADCVDQSMLASNNTTNTVANMTSATLGGYDSKGIYGMGNYYNWYSATAGTGTYSVTFGDATGDICPTGWHLPTGGIASGEFFVLSETLKTPGLPQSALLMSYPNNFIKSGWTTTKAIGRRGTDGYFMSSTAASDYSEYWIEFSDASSVTINSLQKSYGGTARCVSNY